MNAEPVQSIIEYIRDDANRSRAINFVLIAYRGGKQSNSLIDLQARQVLEKRCLFSHCKRTIDGQQAKMCDKIFNL